SRPAPAWDWRSLATFWNGWGQQSNTWLQHPARTSAYFSNARDFVKPKILFVEDESTARKSMASLLADEGYEVLQAEDGPQALALTSRCEPDLILLDIRLPGMDGLAVLERLRAKQTDIAVLVMTADTTSSTAIRA